MNTRKPFLSGSCQRRFIQSANRRASNPTASTALPLKMGLILVNWTNLTPNSLIWKL